MFETVEDYENSIDFLNSLNIPQLNEWENSIQFKSLRRNSDNKNAYVDNIFGTLMNQNSQIVIQNKLFTIDVAAEKITVSDFNNKLKSDGVKEFSTQQNVIDIVFKNGTDTDFYNGKLKADKVEHIWYTNDATRRIEADIRYFSLGIYFTLIIEIEHRNKVIIGGGTSWQVFESGGIYMGYSVDCTSQFRVSKTVFKSAYDVNVTSQSRWGTKPDYDYRIWNSTNRLDAYNITVYFDCESEENGLSYSRKILTLENNKAAIKKPKCQ